MDNHFKKWLEAAVIRAVRTFAQAAAAELTVGAMTVYDVDWKTLLGTAALSALYSMLLAVAGLPEVEGENENPD